MEDNLFELRKNLMRDMSDIRRSLGYTQNDISKITGYAQHRVSDIESGRCNVTIDTLNNILKVLKVRLTLERV